MERNSGVLVSSPRPLSIVEDCGRFGSALPGRYVFLGEIPNMPGHCVLAEQATGRIVSGHHSERFTEVPPEDV